MNEEALQHFRSVCQQEFQFLIDDYRFVPAPLPAGRFVNQFQYRLSNGNLTLAVEGINYGMNAMVSIQDNHGRSVGMECLVPGWQPLGKRKKRKQTKNQDQQIAEAAQQLMKHGQDILAGDLTRFNEIGDRLNRIRDRFRERRTGQQ